MSATDQPSGLAHVLSQRPDDELVALLGARPDLASPPPGGVNVLAQRAMSAGSINVVGEELDLLHAAILEVLLAATEGDRGSRARRAVSDAAVRKALSGRAAAAQINAHLATPRRPRHRLAGGRRTTHRRAYHRRSALARPTHRHRPSAPHAPPVAGTARRPRRRSARSPHRPRDGPQRRDDQRRRTRRRPGATGPRLLAAGLVARVDRQLVEIHPTVAQLIRGEPPLRIDDLRPPPLPAATTTASALGGPAALSATAAGAALELLRETADVLDSLGRTPAPELSSSGIGIRELRRIAKDTGLTAQRVGLILELCAAQQLIAVGYAQPESQGYDAARIWAPTRSPMRGPTTILRASGRAWPRPG